MTFQTKQEHRQIRTLFFIGKIDAELFARCSLLGCLLVVARCSLLLVAHYFLLAVPYFLLIPHHFCFVAHYFLLFASYFLFIYFIYIGFFNYLGFKPFCYKAEIVRTLLHCDFKIRSSWFLFHEEVVEIKHYLEKNYDPLSFVDKQSSFL